jgi:hypothetical protein
VPRWWRPGLNAPERLLPDGGSSNHSVPVDCLKPGHSINRSAACVRAALKKWERAGTLTQETDLTGTIGRIPLPSRYRGRPACPSPDAP